MSELEQALELIERHFRSRYIEYDEDGDEYWTADSKEWGRYRKVMDNLKNMIGNPHPLKVAEERTI